MNAFQQVHATISTWLLTCWWIGGWTMYWPSQGVPFGAIGKADICGKLRPNCMWDKRAGSPFGPCTLLSYDNKGSESRQRWSCVLCWRLLLLPPSANLTSNGCADPDINFPLNMLIISSHFSRDSILWCASTNKKHVHVNANQWWPMTSIRKWYSG